MLCVEVGAARRKSAEDYDSILATEMRDYGGRVVVRYLVNICQCRGEGVRVRCVACQERDVKFLRGEEEAKEW